MEASLQVLRSLRKVHSMLWTFPAPTILVGERDVWLGSLKQLDRPEAVGLLFLVMRARCRVALLLQVLINFCFCLIILL